MIEAPITVLAEDGIVVFASVGEAEAYIEAIDVEDGV